MSMACWPAAAAHAAESPDRAALRRAQQTIARLQTEKGDAERRAAEAAAALDAAVKDRQGLKSEVGRARGGLASAQQQVGRLEAVVAELKQRIARAESAQKEGARELQQCRADGARLEQASADSEKRHLAEARRLQTLLSQETAAGRRCLAANQKLHELTLQIVKQYERDAGGKIEPLLGLGLVEIENKAQDFRDRADESRLAPRGAD
jgi:predicted  nucleic acid-binding Zn-ribbon protein